MNTLKQLFGLTSPVPTIRRKVGEALNIMLLADTQGLAVHSIGFDLRYPANLRYTDHYAGEFDVTTVNSFPADHLAYIAAEQNDEPKTGDGLTLAGVSFACDAAGEGLIIAIDSVHANRREAGGGFTALPTGHVDAPLAVEASEAEIPDGAKVIVRVVVE